MLRYHIVILAKETNENKSVLIALGLMESVDGGGNMAETICFSNQIDVIWLCCAAMELKCIRVIFGSVVHFDKHPECVRWIILKCDWRICKRSVYDKNNNIKGNSKPQLSVHICAYFYPKFK